MTKFIQGALVVLVGLVLLIAIMSQFEKKKVLTDKVVLTPVTQAK
ncbi:MAG: hypothetical protein WCJ94_06160 [bacterium]